MPDKAVNRMTRAELESESASLARQKRKIADRQVMVNGALDAYRALDVAAIPPERLKQINLNAESDQPEAKPS